MLHTLSGRLALAYVAIGAVLRLVLIHEHGPAGVGAATWLGFVAWGAAIDAAVALVVAAVPGVVAALSPGVLRRSWSMRFGLVTLVAFGLLYEAAVEYFFFDEFNSRFNHIALDYVLYPKEVFGNIYQSFNVGRHAIQALVGALAIALLVVGRPRKQLEAAGVLPGDRVFRALASLGIGAVAMLGLWHSPSHYSEDRVANEVALSGPVQLARALWNASIDYDAFYLTLPLDEARARAAGTLGFEPPVALDIPDFRLVRAVTPLRDKPLRSIVVVLEESLGTDWVGCFGADPPDMTPNIDRWSKRGLLLTNLFATGNRTVRGLESVLCSMVPLPGDSIVKRTRTDDVDGLAKVLVRAGYQTAFYYGGRGLFDNIRNFATAVGYQHFHEQSDFPDDCFSTAWGVADQYIFDAALARQREAKSKNEKLFVTILSVSNHKPFLVPPGPWGAPGERNRRVAVRYSDWALGRWLDAMEKDGLLEDTAVLVVGDHGARVYGSERIPIRSYRVPALFLVPGTEWAGKKLARLCSQIDLPPTLLALAGVGVSTPFLGTSVVNLPDAGGRAFVQHNHELGMLDDTNMAVLGLRRSALTYHRSPQDSFWPTGEHTELEKDAASVFQTAHHLYRDGNYNTGETKK